MSIVAVFSTIFVIVISTYVYFKYVLYNYWKKRNVVCPDEPTIPFGNIGQVIGGKVSAGEVLAKAYANHKKERLFGMYAFHKPAIVIAEPDLIRLVLTKNFEHFDDRGGYCNEEIDPLSGHLAALPGEKWRSLRGKLTPTFTSGKIKHMFVTLVKCGEILTKHLKPIADKRQVVEIKDLYSRFSIDVIMSVAFGVDCNCIDNPDSEFRYWGRKNFECGPIHNAMMSFSSGLMQAFSIPANDRGVTRFFTTLFKETVEYREANNIVKPDFLHLLMQLMKDGRLEGDLKESTLKLFDATGGKLSMLQATAQAFLFFMAGFETSSSTIAFCLYEMALNPEIQEKVTTDIEAGLEKCGGLTYESLQEMRYLHKVVSETMRKYPALSMINRICTKDIVLPTTNVLLSKGVSVVVPILGIQRDPEFYPDPDKFDPERFSDKNIAERHPYVYLPFGEGPRICIALRFAYAQVKVGVISMLLKYRVSLGPNTQVPIEFNPGNVILTANHNMNLRLEPRQ